MPCYSMRKRRQTPQQRKSEVKAVVEKVNAGLLRRSIKPVIGPQGGIAFLGLSAAERDDVTDACIYREIMVTGSALVRAEIARAEQLAGRVVDRAVVAAGVHSHDGGMTWGRD